MSNSLNESEVAYFKYLEIKIKSFQDMANSYGQYLAEQYQMVNGDKFDLENNKIIRLSDSVVKDEP